MKVLFHSGTTYLHTINYIGKRSNVKNALPLLTKSEDYGFGYSIENVQCMKHYVMIYFMNTMYRRERGDYKTLCLSVQDKLKLDGKKFKPEKLKIAFNCHFPSAVFGSLWGLRSLGAWLYNMLYLVVNRLPGFLEACFNNNLN